MAKILTPEFRILFPSLFEPNVFEGVETGYQCQMLFSKTDTGIEWLETHINALKKDAWPHGMPAGSHAPVSDGDETGKAPGCWVIRAKSKFRPEVVDANVKAIIDPNEIYSGCYCRASIDLWPYNKKTMSGIYVVLCNVQKLRDGDRLGGGTTADQDFEPVRMADPGFYRDS